MPCAPATATTTSSLSPHSHPRTPSLQVLQAEVGKVWAVGVGAEHLLVGKVVAVVAVVVEGIP